MDLGWGLLDLSVLPNVVTLNKMLSLLSTFSLALSIA